METEACHLIHDAWVAQSSVDHSAVAYGCLDHCLARREKDTAEAARSTHAPYASLATKRWKTA